MIENEKNPILILNILLTNNNDQMQYFLFTNQLMKKLTTVAFLQKNPFYSEVCLFVFFVFHRL